MRSKTITMIDYGGSNLRSAQKAFEYIGADVRLTSDPEDVLKADKLTLPGVGAFGSGIAAVRERNLEEAIVTAVAKGTPLLGICIGMQFLFDESDEMGVHKGLGLIPGHVTRFPEKLSMVNEENPISNRQSSIVNLKVPHMGWNQLEFDVPHPLLTHVKPGSHTYFVHSYHCIPQDENDVVATTDYGGPFTAIVGRDNVYGLQFHPEKSQQTGLQIIRNYVELM